MNIAPQYAPWLELGLVLTTASLGIVAAARLAECIPWTAVGRRTIWRVASAAMLLVLVVELTGLGKIAAQWMRGSFETLQATPAVAVETGNESFAASAISPDADSSLWPRQPARESTDAPRTEWADSTLITDDFLSFESDGTRRVAGEPFRELRLPLATDVTANVSAGEPASPDFTPPTTSGPALPSNSPAAALAPMSVSAPAAWPALVWLLGSGLIGAYALVGYVVSATLHRRAKRATDTALRRRVDRLATRLGIRGLVRLIESRRLKTPAAFGLFRPTIAVPSGFQDDFAEDQQDAVIVHELAHLAGGDSAWHLAVNLLTAVLWWQPAVWLLRRRLFFISETAADEATLMIPAGPEHLAASLVAMGRRLIDRPQLGWLPMTGDGYRSNLGRRVTRLLRLQTEHWRKPRRRLAAWCKSGLVLLLVVALVLGSAWIRPQAAHAEGESTMTKFRLSWSRSLAAAAVAAILGPMAVGAPAEQPPTKGGQLEAPADLLVAVLQEDEEEEHERREVIRDEEEREEREFRREREEEERDREREERERDEEEEEAEHREREMHEREVHEREAMEHRERVLHELERERDELMERAAHLKRELSEDPEGAEGRELRHALEEVMHAAERVERKMVEVRRGERPRHEAEGHEQPEERLHAMMREREELMQLGRNLMQKLEERKRDRDEAAAREIAEKVENVKREIAEIDQAAMELRAHMTEHQRAEHEHPHREGPPREEIERRMRHLHAAAENLHAAGLHDQAEELMRQAERLAHEAGPPRREAPREPLEGAVHDLQRQVHEMRGQMEEMQRALRMLLERESR